MDTPIIVIAVLIAVTLILILIVLLLKQNKPDSFKKETRDITFTPDGEKLFFVSNMATKQAGTNIPRVFRPIIIISFLCQPELLKRKLKS